MAGAVGSNPTARIENFFMITQILGKITPIRLYKICVIRFNLRNQFAERSDANI
jgi:hypothetical protein